MILERHVEMIALSGTTPEEIAAAYAQTLNERWKNPQVTFSQFSGQMMRYAPCACAIREIKGKWFAEIEYAFWDNPSQDDEEDPV